MVWLCAAIALPPMDVPFSADGRWLAITAWEDQTVRLWHMQLDDLIELACRTTGRNMTVEECRQFVGDPQYRKACPCWPGPEETCES